MIEATESDRERRLALLEKLRRGAVGLDVHYQLATGERSRRIYLDSTASTLRLQVVDETVRRFLPYYSNTHSVLHFGAKLSTTEYAWAHQMVLDFVHADPDRYTAFFVGSGATGGINRVARTLCQRRPERDVVVTSIMEHHSNDLPHRKHAPVVVHVPAATVQTSIGQVCLRRIEEALVEHRGRVNYVAITGVSNVTGIINPIHDVAELAHAHGALLVVDAAQMAAHLPIHVCGHANPARELDVVVLSGHKIYAPGSPGVVVTRKDLFADLEPQEVGGGMVEDVYLNRYTMSQRFPDREEAGTPNICGALALGAALHALSQVGMDVVAAEESRLIEYCVDRLTGVEDLILYGERDCRACRRAGAVSFNIKGVDHGLTAAVLNDYFNISVRNECFCAHPYVREMITEALAEDEDVSEEELENLAEMHNGMVRASFGIYSTEADVDALVAALSDIAARRDEYAQLYERDASGDYRHKTFAFDPGTVFSVRGAVDNWLAQR